MFIGSGIADDDFIEDGDNPFDNVNSLTQDKGLGKESKGNLFF